MRFLRWLQRALQGLVGIALPLRWQLVFGAQIVVGVHLQILLQHLACMHRAATSLVQK